VLHNARFLKIFFYYFFLWILLVVGCIPSDLQEKNADKVSTSHLMVVATTGMVADVAKNVGKELVAVETLMGAGVDPHLYKASIRDISKMNQADLVLYSGLHLEGKMSDVLRKFSRRKKAVALSDGIDPVRLLRADPESPAHDPHIWMDVSLWSQSIDPVLKAFIQLDPENANIYRKNAEAYRTKLLMLHKECLEKIQQIPKPQRVLITAHDAFRYFGRAYGVEVLGIQGISTESEAGLQEINRLVDVIVRRSIRAVFVESSVSTKNIQALVEGAKSRGADVKLGGELYSDAMGTPGTPEGTYIGMIRYNVQTIVEGLR
jgi:manganese/zinc/iron transport system substrate-binding protein